MKITIALTALIYVGMATLFFSFWGAILWLAVKIVKAALS